MVDKDICELNHKNINEKIDKLDKRVEKMENIYETLQKWAYETSRLREDFAVISDRVLNLESKPAKKYEALVTYVSFAIIGGLIAFLLTYLGLK